MKVSRHEHPALWASLPSAVRWRARVTGLSVDDERYMRFRREADRIYKHMSPEEKDAAAMHMAITHPGFHGLPSPEHHRRRKLAAAGIILLALAAMILFSYRRAHAAPLPAWNTVPIQTTLSALRRGPFLFPQIIVNPSQFKFDASNNLDVNCITGCSASAGFTDNSAFTVGASTINPMGAYFTSGADPACTTGNACRLRIDASSNLRVNCVTGCSASAGFADNAAFTAGTTPIGIIGGWFSNAPTACTSGSACSPSLTSDRKLFVQDFQGTSPWVVSLTSTTITGTVAVTQSTSPWVASCTVANCSVNVGNWGGTALGTPTNFGTTPGAVIAGSVNASLFSGTTALGTPNTFGTTAPTGNALGVNASLFIGTTLAANSGAGIQKVGIGGNAAGAAMDAANNAALPANVLLTGAETIAQGTQPTASTGGNARRHLADLDGAQYVNLGGSNRFSCFVENVTATTQCQAAPGAGLRAYVSDFYASNEAATIQTLDVVFGTGANCVTGTTALTHKFEAGTADITTSPFEIHAAFLAPLVPTAANAICVRPTAATAFGATLTGYIAP